VLAASLGLAGCTHDATATPTSGATGSSTSTESSDAASSKAWLAEPTAPTRPAEWTEAGESGAVAAARYVADLFNYVMATGDLREWSAISDEFCDFCVLAAMAGGLYRDGGGITGGILTLESDPAVTINEANGPHTVAFDYTATPSVAKDALTKRSISSPAEAGTLVMDLEFTGNGWILMELRSAMA